MKAQEIKHNAQLPRPKLNFRLLHNAEIAFGPGKADLLEAIEKTGSISAAGKAMNMSYRRAWMLVDTMNNAFIEPLVLTAKGGQHGGGAVLTPLGQQVLAQYRLITKALDQTIQAYLPLFSGMMKTLDDNKIEQQKNHLDNE